MPNLAKMLKEEIQRLARKEVRRQVRSARTASAQFRRDIAAMKRQLQRLAKSVAFLERQERGRLGQRPAPEAAEGTRFSARGVKAHRTRLGLSARDYGRLVGVSGLTIYNWEAGSSRPRAPQLAALVAVRTLGKREAQKRLELLER